MQPPISSIASVQKAGVRVAGISAGQPMGSVNVTIANFTGTADTNMNTTGLIPLSTWYSRTDSNTLGSQILLLRPAAYTVMMHVAMSTAARVQAGILRGSAAAPANPILSAGLRILAAFDHLGAAAGSFHTCTLTANFLLANADIDGNQNMVRFMYSNAAGAAPGAGIGSVLGENGFTITKDSQLQSVA